MLSKQTLGVPRRKTLSRDIAEILTRRITSGQYEVGSKMPTERLLSLEFGVNRHAVREALKRLEAIGLIRIKHGAGIFIERINFTAGWKCLIHCLQAKMASLTRTFFVMYWNFADR